MSVGDDESFTRGNIQNPGDPELFADIRRMIDETRAEYGPQILLSLSAKLSWSHFRQIISLDEYLTALPSKEVLQQRLHTAIEQSHKRLKNQGVGA